VPWWLILIDVYAVCLAIMALAISTAPLIPATQEL
jgi:hypothetical protein